MNLENKTDRELMEEIILQNIKLYKQGIDINKKVDFLFIVSILGIIGTIFFLILLYLWQ